VEKPELYFPRDVEWREWLDANHLKFPQGVELIFYKLETKVPTMRWEEAVKVALCYGWIDSTVRGMGNGKRKQYFCPRNPKSSWSALNKKYVAELERNGRMHESGRKVIENAKKSRSWSEMDDVENLIVPEDLQLAFNKNPEAFSNYSNFAPGYRKSYLSWLHQAKKTATREKRIEKILELCRNNNKSRS
jgi:uncharacterized protein YdeI (YjbR/CyaY-like superfamily)